MNVKKVPLRQCTGCGQMMEKKSMMRVIKTNLDEIELDITGKKNGRGAYVCKSFECFEKAVNNRGFERSLKIRIPQEVYLQLKEELEKNGFNEGT